ncbi:hypothetical protein LQL77_30005 [Rhodococcus cerastii]|nr:hypothetical protein [Rhodococcus cerastii]
MLLQSVSAQVVATVRAAGMAAVTVLSACDKAPVTVACTDVRVLDVVVDQCRANEGPCLEAVRTRQVVRVRIDDAERRWPDFAEKGGAGVASYLSVPLTTDENQVEALNLYGYDDRGSARSTRCSCGCSSPLWRVQSPRPRPTHRGLVDQRSNGKQSGSGQGKNGFDVSHAGDQSPASSMRSTPRIETGEQHFSH